MTRNEELIEKYKKRIEKMEEQIKQFTSVPIKLIQLTAKISVLKLVIIDLQE